MTAADALRRLRPLADRWNETKCWHDPPFHDGTIKITTQDLHALSVLLERLALDGLAGEAVTNCRACGELTGSSTKICVSCGRREPTEEGQP